MARGTADAVPPAVDEPLAVGDAVADGAVGLAVGRVLDEPLTVVGALVGALVGVVVGVVVGEVDGVAGAAEAVPEGDGTDGEADDVGSGPGSAIARTGAPTTDVVIMTVPTRTTRDRSFSDRWERDRRRCMASANHSHRDQR